MKNTVKSIAVIAIVVIGGFIGTGIASAEPPTDNHDTTTSGGSETREQDHRLARFCDGASDAPYCGRIHWEH